MTTESAKALRLLSCAVIAAGLVGLVGAVLGWDKNKAAPALFAADAAFASFWGLVMLATISMIGREASSLRRQLLFVNSIRSRSSCWWASESVG
jgi:hypothetical protein